jgi:Domain of unknown function (DUF4421)
MMKRTLFFISTLLCVSVFAQVEIDASPVDSTVSTDRYVDYSNQLLLKVMTVVKSNKQVIENTNNSQSLKLSPYGISSLGFGFNYKWLGLGIAFGLPASDEDVAKYGKTKRFDFQLNIYSKKFVIDAFAQQYNGYYIENPTELTNWNETFFPQRDSMETISIGVGGFYVFNHKKLSYKAAYVRNAVQKKSAGSFLLGGFYNLDYAGFKSGSNSYFIPNYFPVAVQDTFGLTGYKARSFGVSFGYSYTVVFLKHFFINASLIPGVGIKDLTVGKTDGEEINEKGAAARFVVRAALGYENKYFLMGLTTYTTTGTYEFDGFKIQPSTNNVKVFIAKRFDLSRKKKIKTEEGQ